MNVVGGIHIDEPAIDLGIVAAVTSSLRECPIDFYDLGHGRSRAWAARNPRSGQAEDS